MGILNNLYKMKSKIINILLICFIFIILICKSEVLKKTGESKLTFKPPRLTLEEENSKFMPDTFKCDACHAITFQLHKRFQTFNEQHPNFKYNLPESEMIDLVEDICETKTFEGYGVKTVAGVNRLFGAGVKLQEEAGMISGGGVWPGRLNKMCMKFVEDIGEEGIYQAYREKPNSLSNYRLLLCNQESGSSKGACNFKKTEGDVKQNKKQKGKAKVLKTDPNKEDL